MTLPISARDSPVRPWVYYFATAPWMLIGASVAESLMATGLDLVWMLVIIDFAGQRRTPQYVAICTTLAGVRGILGPLAGGALIELAGVRSVYVVAAVLMAAGACLLSRQLRQQRVRFSVSAVARPSFAR